MKNNQLKCEHGYAHLSMRKKGSNRIISSKAMAK